MPNSLATDILKLLQQHPQGLSEHELLQLLCKHSCFASLTANAQLALFQKHFILMNALYQLQEELWQTQHTKKTLNLEISPLCIKLQTSPPTQQALSTDHSNLATYYLDWNNFQKTTEEDVSLLLDNFWSIFTKNSNRTKALSILELEPNANADTIKERYRELANQHHPDKGGDQETFIHIRQAYETLKSN